MNYQEWIDGMRDLERDDQLAYIRVTLEDKKMIDIFARCFFPDEVHREEETPEFHMEFVDEMAKPKSSVLIMPRGHAKTTLARIDLIHDIVYKHEDFIVLIGDVLSSAKNSFAYVKSQLESNILLMDVYGDLVPSITKDSMRKWSDSHFETTNGVVCIARGAGKGRGLNIKAKRPSKVLIDDLEDDQKVKSKQQREKTMNWMKNVIMPSIDPERGKIKMIGTVLHYDCLLLDRFKAWGGVKRAALEKNGKPSLAGDPIFPSRFSREKLEEIKKDMGTFPFSQEYMNEPMSDENADVKLAWIRYVDGLGKDSERDQWKFYSALDPAISTKTSADESAICTAALKAKLHDDEDIRIVIMPPVHGQFGMTGTIQQAQAVYKRYPHESFGCEVVAFQEGLRQLLSTNGVPAVAVSPKSKDKRSRLLNIIGLIEFGNIVFMKGCEDLVDQLIQFPNGKNDDLVDSMVYAVELALASRRSGGLLLLQV
jgi:predicted phage terminase large subunit-like protein